MEWCSRQTQKFNRFGTSNPQSAIFGFTSSSDDANTKNHILLIFKCFVYKYRNKSPNSRFLFDYVKSIAELEKSSCEVPAKVVTINKKWEKLIPYLWVFLLPFSLTISFTLSLSLSLFLSISLTLSLSLSLSPSIYLSFLYLCMYLSI